LHSIKPIQSSWSLNELNLVAKGGNSDFLSFISVYNIPATSTLEYKYSTIACKYYREHLLALALNRTCEFPTPTLEEALKTEPVQSSLSFLESIESKKKNFEAFTEINSLKSINEKTSDLFKNIKNGLRVKALESFEVFDHLIDLGKEKSSVIVKKVRSGTDLLKQTADTGRITMESGSRLLTEGLNKGKSLINDGVLYIRSASFSPSVRKRNNLN
jgi:hypothetical protein